MTHKFTWRSQTWTLHKHPAAIRAQRLGKLTEAQLAARPWYIRLTVAGKLRDIRLGDHRTAEAVAIAKKTLAQRAEDQNALAGALDSLRPVRNTYPTFRVVVDAMHTAPVSTTAHTRAGYASGTKVFLETTLGTLPAWDSHTVDVLTPDLVYKYRAAIHARSQAEHWDDARRARAYRSGNSVLRDIRALFTPALQEYYRIAHKLTLPDLTPFREAPGFDGATKTSSQYRRPSDDLLRTTLTELQATRDTHRARFLLIWLALGFGLRKSEAAAVRVGWFRTINGRIHLELRAVVEPGSTTESPVTKNGDQSPLIPVANDAWTHLGPLLEGQPADAYAVPAEHATERRDTHFRAISAWLQGLGWETGKQYHEFRALAGAWVYDACRDLYRVSRWMRHSSVTVTEKAYGRYNSTDTPDAPAAAVLAAIASPNRDAIGDAKGYGNQTLPNDAKEASFGVVSGQPIEAQAVNFPLVTPEPVVSERLMRP